MRDKKELLQILQDIEGAEPGEAQRLTGDYDFSRYSLRCAQVDVAGDHVAVMLLIRVPQSVAGFPLELFNTPVRRTALEDLLIRNLAAFLRQSAAGVTPFMGAALLGFVAPSPAILPRTALLVGEDGVEARLQLRLPLLQGAIRCAPIRALLLREIPALVGATMLYCNLEAAAVRHAIELMEQADQVRQVLATQGLISFLAEGTDLARTTAAEKPRAPAQPLAVAPEARMELNLPGAGVIAGLGIPAGITLLLADNYEERIAFLRTVADGIYNHCPGDGRELAITLPDAVYVPADAGRAMQGVDLSLFFKVMPDGGDPENYSTLRADAVVAQAAATVEAIEVGARVLIYEEMDSTLAFLVGDARLGSLPREGKLGLNPLAACARQLVETLGISLLIGGGGAVAEFVPLADRILYLSGQTLHDITQSAKAEVRVLSAEWEARDVKKLVSRSRWIIPSSVDPSRDIEDSYVHMAGSNCLQIGSQCVSLAPIRQLADAHQAYTIGMIVAYAKLRYLDQERPLREVLDLVDRDLSTEGLEGLAREIQGNLARPRRYEVAAVINRLPGLRVKATNA